MVMDDKIRKQTGSILLAVLVFWKPNRTEKLVSIKIWLFIFILGLILVYIIDVNLEFNLNLNVLFWFILKMIYCIKILW